MTNYAPKKLRAIIEKKDNGTATYTITLSREVHLSEDVKYWLGRVANGGRSKCFVSPPQTDKTMLEISISRGPTGDAAVVYEKLYRILTEIAKILRIAPQHITVMYLSDRVDAITLSDMGDMIKRLNDSTHQRRTRRSMYAMS